MVNGFDGVPGRKYEDFESLEAAIREWVQQVPGFERFDSEMLGIGRSISCKDWLTVDGEKKTVRIPPNIAFGLSDLRDWQALPGRGAWTCAHFWMVAGEWVLRSELDWMREPVFDDGHGPERPKPHSCYVELERHPRDPEFIPDWMAAGAAQWEKRQAALARRRERDRARRAAKRAEKAAKQTEQTGDTTTGQAPSAS
ncbi:hypothetical protein [Actinomyces gaoshouyii]|uniref:hypothetical protein n=1 Tax=Actinomyces gaoshouyii TaxID=1960083 RepID=UPI001F0A0F5D|nr:hypothetical protein [Actinomyces gaoshouyii]